MLASQPHMSFRHALPHNIDIFITLFQTNLEVAVTPITRKPIIHPRRRQQSFGHTVRIRFVVVGELGIIWLEEFVELGVALLV